MDTLCNNYPTLKIKIEYPFKSNEYKITTFYSSREQMRDTFKYSFSLKELDSFYLYFDSDDSDAKLYMDGLEFIPDNISKHSNTYEDYLSPSKNYYPMYIYDSGCYPFRVGIYEIRIEEYGQVYYALLRIEPRHINSEEWVLLRDDLEMELRGLSQDLVRKKIGFGDNVFASLPVGILQEFLIINKYANNLLGALIDLKDRPNFKIEKEYKKRELCEAKNIDNVTIKDYLIKGSESDRYLIPDRIVSYDLQENRWIKKIIETYEENLNKFLESIHYSKLAIISEIESSEQHEYALTEAAVKKNLLEQLDIYESTAVKILKISNILKLQEWYNKVTPLKDGYTPHVLVMDARYGVLYNLYNDLKSKKFNVDIDKNYAYVWKNTYKLYEIWCFIKIYKMLISDTLNFNPQYDMVINNEHSILIPMIAPGTCLTFKKNNIIIKLYYDKIIPNTYEKTDCHSDPIFTSGRHNKPDARLDIYIDNLYIRSIIFEFKYRTINNFWNKNNNTASYDQIISYKDNTKSIYIENYKPKKSMRFRPVEEVWVLHPTYDKNENVQTLEKFNEGVKIVRMRPGEDLQEIVVNLNNSINEIVESM